jgi:hypothetical protein
VIQSRLEMDDYTARVLDVIKGKFGLKNRSEALRKLALEAGNEYVEVLPNERFLRELDTIYESHKKKNGNRKMNDKELKRLLGL